MTLRKFVYLLQLAEEVGIKTFGELAAYKAKKQLRTNSELFVALYSDKCRLQCADLSA